MGTQDRNGDFFREMVEIAGFGAAFAAIPLFASMEDLQPPWPKPVAYISAAFIILAALLAREFGPGLKSRGRRLMLIIAAALSVVGLFSYLFLYSRFVFSIPGGDRIILGYACNAVTEPHYASCPNLSDLELRRAAYNPELLYTKTSLDVVRLSLVAAWMLFTAGLMGAVGWAVSSRRLGGRTRHSS